MRRGSVLGEAVDVAGTVDDALDQHAAVVVEALQHQPAAVDQDPHARAELLA